jgi:hypothetical protein
VEVLSSSWVAAKFPARLFLLLAMIEICSEKVASAGVPFQTDAASVGLFLELESNLTSLISDLILGPKFGLILVSDFIRV